MAALKSALAAAMLALSSPSQASPVDRWAASIREASGRFQVPEAWIRKVMKAESGGHAMRLGRPIRSRAGAMGLMQLMPATWQEMRTLHSLGLDPDDPRDNILAGTAYLRAMYDRFGYPGLFAAYNAGPARFAHYLRTGGRLPGETLAYVRKVTSGQVLPATRRDSRPTGLPPIFVMNAGQELIRRAPRPGAASPLFAILARPATGKARPSP